VCHRQNDQGNFRSSHLDGFSGRLGARPVTEQNSLSHSQTCRFRGVTGFLSREDHSFTRNQAGSRRGEVEVSHLGAEEPLAQALERA